MSAEFFVDTSAWYPLVVASHPDHAKLARALRTRIREGRRVVTTNLIVAETHALLMRRASIPAALEYARTIGGPPNIIVHSTAELEIRAVRDWLARYDDHDISLADAVSFAVMSERKIDEALTLDHHFKVAGFRAIKL